ncbi:MAG: response regulator transcription factor [Acidovorax sp.]|jgi:DNA-binding NarL/FixJ family response regulator|nr:response regulator transcription factor [Acidovorax sp.]
MKLLLVDDHPLFCVGFAHALTHALPGAQMLTAATLDAGLKAAVGAEDLDLVLLDQRLGVDTGIKGLRLFAEKFPLVTRVLISGDEDPALAAAASAAGASGFLGKSRSVPALAAALQRIAQGDVVFDGLTAVPASVTSRASPCTPTARQCEVLTLLALGHPNKRIAQELGIAERTVKLHVTALLGHLQARNRTHLLAVAHAQGLLPQ